MGASANGSRQWHEETVKVGDTDLTIITGGSGRPLLVLHEELGWPGWLKWNAALALKHRLVIPLHPGYSQTPRVEWITNVRDLGGFYANYLMEQNLAPIDVVGFSLGGWIAAEMAAANPHQFRKMVLVAPMGIRPQAGDIFDFFQVMAPQQLLMTVHDADRTAEFDDLFGGVGPEQFERWEEARAQTARLAWSPFMHNPSLPHLLPVARNLPTKIVWGREDKMVPIGALEPLQRALKNAQVTIFDSCGHRPEVEQTAEFVNAVDSFLE
jgi:pimeloyl-ACP methyl ester carboxylesterase